MKTKWDHYDDFEETYDLLALVDSGWAWEWPGWAWVADKLNDEHGNNRSAAACKGRYERVEKARAALVIKQLESEGVSNE